MIDQVLNMKKRYANLVSAFTPKDFEGWFAEFYGRYPFIEEVLWENEYDIMTEPCITLSRGYVATHPDLIGVVGEDGSMDSTKISKSWKTDYPELFEAVTDLRHLLSAEDVIFSALGRDVLISATKHSLIITGWDKGTSHVTNEDSH